MMWRVATLVLVVLLALAAYPALRHLRESAPAPEPAVRLALSPPEDVEFGSGNEPFDLAIAPPGREIVFAAVKAGETQLWRRTLEGTRAEPIGGTTAATQPAYSANGTAILFFARGKLRRVTLSTGEHRDLADAPTPGGLAVRDDDAILFVPANGPVMRLASGKATAVTTLRAGDRTHAFPAWTGDGDAFVYLAVAGDRRTIRLHDGDGDVDLVRADSHGIVRRGHLLYVRDGALRAEPFDAVRRLVRGRAATLALSVGVTAAGRGAFAADERLLVWSPPVQRARALRWFSAQGAPLDAIAEPGDYWQVRLSSDERSVAVTMTDPLLRTLDVFTLPARGGPMTRVTLALAADTDPVWSPDGRLAFRSLEGGQPQIHSEAGPLYQSTLDEFPTDWTNSLFVFHARSAESGFDIWALPAGASEARPLARSGFNETDGRISPDGRWLAYVSDEPGQSDVYVARLDDARRRIRVSTAGGTKPQWVGPSALVFARGDDLLRAPLTTNGEALQAGTPVRIATLPGLRDYAVTRSGERVLALVQTGSTPGETLAVLVGWPALVGGS